MIDEGPLEALAAWGAPAEIVHEWRRILTKQAAERGVEVWPQHWHALRVFLGMATQWRVIAGARRLLHLGLDYAALPIVLAEHRANPHRVPLAELMPQLRVLEEAACEERNGG